MKIFEQELESLINRNSVEAGSNTPDFVLAAYLRNCLIAFDTAVNRRDEWYGVTLAPGSSTAATPAPALAATQEEVAALVERLRKASSMIGDMCSEGRCPKMSIPARPGVDEDLFICDAIDAAIALLQRKGGAL